MFAALCAASLCAAGLVATAAAQDAQLDSSAATRSSPESPRVGLPARAGNALVALGSDIGYVVTSPFRLNRNGVLKTVAVLGVTGMIYVMDDEILARLQRGDSPVYEGIADVGDALEPAGFMPNSLMAWGSAALVGKIAGWNGLETASLQIIESHLIGGGIRNASKWLIGRRRPNEEKSSQFFEFNGGTSFPSGHAAVMFEAATVLSMRTKSLPVSIVCYTAATSVAIQRIESKGHWPSDVFLTAVVSTVVARAVVRRWESREAKRQEGASIGFEPRGAGAALTVRF